MKDHQRAEPRERMIRRRFLFVLLGVGLVVAHLVDWAMFTRQIWTHEDMWTDIVGLQFSRHSGGASFKVSDPEEIAAFMQVFSRSDPRHSPVVDRKATWDQLTIIRMEIRGKRWRISGRTFFLYDDPSALAGADDSYDDVWSTFDLGDAPPKIVSQLRSLALSPRPNPEELQAELVSGLNEMG